MIKHVGIWIDGVYVPVELDDSAPADEIRFRPYTFGDQMKRVDEATLREVVTEAPRRLCIEGQTAPAQWPNTDPTLTVFHAPKENGKKGSTIKVE